VLNNYDVSSFEINPKGILEPIFNIKLNKLTFISVDFIFLG